MDVFVFHSSRLSACRSVSRSSSMSFLNISAHLIFGRPIGLFPFMVYLIILMQTCSRGLLLIWPYHLKRFSLIFPSIVAHLVIVRISSFLTLSFRFSPHAHLNILISTTDSLSICLAEIGHDSLPYKRAGLITLLYTFPFSLRLARLSFIYFILLLRFQIFSNFVTKLTLNKVVAVLVH